MAHVSTNSHGFELFAALRGKIRGTRRAISRYNHYRRTLRVLQDLDERTLDDLGLGRADLSRVARESIR